MSGQISRQSVYLSATARLRVPKVPLGVNASGKMPVGIIGQVLLGQRALSTVASDLISRAPPTEQTLSLAQRLLAGDRVALSRAITLCESSNPDHEVQAEHLLQRVLADR